MKNKNTLDPNDVKFLNRYRNGCLMETVPARFMGVDPDGDFIFSITQPDTAAPGGYKLFKHTVSPGCFPVHEWKSGPCGNVTLKTEFWK